VNRWLLAGLLAASLAVGGTALADPKDGNPKVIIRHCGATLIAENRNDVRLHWLIRIDGRLIEEGVVAPGDTIRRSYNGAHFFRIRLGTNVDHYYSSAEGSSHCSPSPSPTPSPNPSPSPSPTPSPSPSPSPEPTPSDTPTPSPSASPTSPSPSPSVPSPTATPPPSAIPTASVSPPGQLCTPPCTDGGTPNTGGGPVFWAGIAIMGLVVLGAALRTFVKRER
jgi:hypothetical protein